MNLLAKAPSISFIYEESLISNSRVREDSPEAEQSRISMNKQIGKSTEKKQKVISGKTPQEEVLLLEILRK